MKDIRIKPHDICITIDPRTRRVGFWDPYLKFGKNLRKKDSEWIISQLESLIDNGDYDKDILSSKEVLSDLPERKVKISKSGGAYTLVDSELSVNCSSSSPNELLKIWEEELRWNEKGRGE